MSIFALSIPLFVAHGIEECLTGFYDVDSWDRFLFGPLAGLSAHGVMFLTFQIMMWLLLIVSFLLLLGPRWQFRMLAVVGIIYVFELHHPVKALIAGSYYPGLATSLLFPIFAVAFWKEWSRIRRQRR